MVLKKGRSVSDGLLRVTILQDVGREDGENVRFGVSITKKVGGAVRRNLVKRRLHALVGRFGGARGRGANVLITAWPAAGGATFAELERSLFGLASSLKVFDVKSA